MNDIRHYEITIIINGILEEDAISQLATRTSEFITRNGGDIKKADHWGRRRLAYMINKKVNGYYVQFTVDGPATLISVLDRYFQLEEHIIRYLTLVLEENDLQNREDMRSRMLAEAQAEEERAASTDGGDNDSKD